MLIMLLHEGLPVLSDAHADLPGWGQFLIEKITRQKIQGEAYWKEHCFALTAETIVDRCPGRLRCIFACPRARVRQTRVPAKPFQPEALPHMQSDVWHCSSANAFVHASICQGDGA